MVKSLEYYDGNDSYWPSIGANSLDINAEQRKLLNIGDTILVNNKIVRRKDCHDRLRKYQPPLKDCSKCERPISAIVFLSLKNGLCWNCAKTRIEANKN